MGSNAMGSDGMDDIGWVGVRWDGMGRIGWEDGIW